jgi:hypothetical protein
LRTSSSSQREWMPLNMRGNQQMRKYHWEMCPQRLLASQRAAAKPPEVFRFTEGVPSEKLGFYGIEPVGRDRGSSIGSKFIPLDAFRVDGHPRQDWRRERT